MTFNFDMATTPITETIDVPRRRRGFSRPALRRVAWLAVDLVAVAACAALALHAVT